jgi:hypothetical protein
MNYPKRVPFFAQKFIRLMTKTAAAQELGPSACWMLSVIACQEDAKRYIEPANYYYDQLMPLCGFSSRKQLRATIEKAVSLGWLNYVPGAKGKPGRFFVSIPERFQEIEPTGCDETFSSDSELQAELQREPKRNCKGNTPIPIPSPNPITVAQVEEQFQKLWEAYPARKGKKIGKPEALAAFKKIKPADIPLVMLAVVELAKSDQLPKDCHRWLQKDHWREWLPQQPAERPAAKPQLAGKGKPLFADEGAA